MTLKNVIRMDSLPVTKATFTPEGYLEDKPILTTTGIFEYGNPDGSIRRELRLPEDVFDKESLESYKGKPIIITHDAGLVTKDNVHRYQIGTILSEGQRSGDDVRADIIVHDTDKMKDCKLKELSLGYNLELDETPGVWRGEHYDAIQKNIRVNHLALVREARAGESARLNLDSRDENNNMNILKGGKPMKKSKKTLRHDGILTPEELDEAIAQYKASHKVAEDAEEEEIVEEEVKTPETVEEKVQYVKDRRDRRDEEGDPEDEEEAMGIIANQDEDIDYLFDIIDTLLAERDMKKDAEGEEEEEVIAEEEEIVPEDEETDADEEEEEVIEEEEIIPEDEAVDADEEEEEIVEEEEEVLPEDEETDGFDDPIPYVEEEDVPLNTDAVDAIVRQRIQIGMIGRALNLDGLERMKPLAAKKRIIKAVRPGIRLDGKSKAYINAAYDCAVADIKSMKKGTGYQKKQMFNKDAKAVKSAPSAMSARAKMIERHAHK